MKVKENIKGKKTNTKAGRTAKRAKPARKEILEEVGDNVRKERTGKRSIVKFAERPRTLTPDAYRWYMDRNAIPGAGHAPYRYCDWRVVDDLFELLGRPLELAEAKMLVQADGKKAVCDIDKTEFQPVRYVRIITNAAAEKIKATKSLEGVELVYGGAYFAHAKVQEGRKFVFSGCIFNSRGGKANGSPLFMAMKGFGDKIYGKKKHALVPGESMVTTEQNRQQHIQWQKQRREQGMSNFRRRQGAMDTILGFEHKAHHNHGGPAEVLHQRDEEAPEKLGSPFAKLQLPPATPAAEEIPKVAEAEVVSEGAGKH